jgi:transcriptional regulator with XRE-family HTH domain
MQQELAKLARDLERYMQEYGLTQEQIAVNTCVDQSTVSRFLKRPPRRNTAPVRRLCKYAETLFAQAESTGDKAVALKALDECWKTSDAHAEAVSKILNALAELCRHNRREGVTPG